MFEDFVFEFDFGAENSGKDEDKIYFNSAAEFNMMTNMLPIEEIGLSFCGEVTIGEGTSILTNKKIKMETSEQAIRTYQKVIEVRELTDLEQEEANKFRLFFKKLFEVFFRNEKWRVYYVSICSLVIGFDCFADNYLGAAILTAIVLSNCSPIKFMKETKKMIGSKKRLEALEEELANMNILGYVNSVEKEDIELYLKPKVPNTL